MPRPSIFVSYSGRTRNDKAFAKELLVRLQDQELDPWIYERRGGEIPAGEDIDEYCRKRIRQAEHFVAIISDSSLESIYTRSEVAFAIAVHGKQAIIQIATTQAPIAEWSSPYLELGGTKHIHAVMGGPADVERCVEDICARAKVTYQPAVLGAAKLPLLARLTEELRKARPDDPQYEVGLFSLLRKPALDAATAYSERRLEHALTALNELISSLEREFGGQPFYYPLLVRGVIEAERGRERSVYLHQAAATFTAIMDDPQLAAIRDENAAAGLAGVYMLQNRPLEALALYRIASNIVAARRETDPDLVHNVILSTITSGTPISPDEAAELTHWKERAFLTKDPYLVERLTVLYALACAYRGETQRAEEVLQTVDSTSPHVADIIFRLAQELAARTEGKDRRADRLTDALFKDAVRVSRGNSVVVLLGQASFFYQRGRFQEALAILRSLLDRFPANPQLYVEAAWCHFQLKQTAQASEQCKLAARIPLPSGIAEMTPLEIRDFLYFRGFAHWLIGQFELAQKDFDDSSFSAERWYETVALNHQSGPFNSPLSGEWLRSSLH